MRIRYIAAVALICGLSLSDAWGASLSQPCWTNGGGVCIPVEPTTPLPVTPLSGSTPLIVTSGAVTAIAGTQTGVAIASATAPTIPATATYILAQAQGTNNTSGVCLFWRDDGTNPTTSAGQALASGQAMWRKVTSDGIKFIQAASATCTVTLSYYRNT